MKINSWHIVILGTIIQSCAILMFPYDLANGGGNMYGIISFMAVISFIIIVLTGIILTALLCFKKTQRIEASLSISI